MNMHMIPERELKRYIVEKIRLSCRTTITPEIMFNSRITRIEEFISNNLIYELEAYFASKTKTTTDKTTRVIKSIDVPATWWDHWKQFAAPEWFKQRYPPKFITIETKLEEIVTTTTTKICPHLAIDPQHDHLEFLVMDTMPAMKSRRIPKS